MERRVDQERCEGLMKEWQVRLGLQDWELTIQPMCAPDEMPHGEAAGCTEWSEVLKVGKIYLLNPLYYGDRLRPFDAEKTIIHELLHLKLCLVANSENDIQERYMHQIIDDLARAFVDAKRYQEQLKPTPQLRGWTVYVKNWKSYTAKKAGESVTLEAPSLEGILQLINMREGQ